MIKHAIPKIEWAIEWVLNYYITRSRQEARQLGSREVADKMWYRKPGGGALAAPDELGTREVADKMW